MKVCHCDDDPCISVAFRDDQVIHNCLGVVGIGNLAQHHQVPALQQGANPVGSKANLVRWLDAIVAVRICLKAH